MLAGTLETMRMKTQSTLLFFLVFSILVSCTDQNDDKDICIIKIPSDTYIFPMTPYSSEWSNLDQEEIWEINQLPYSIIESISTEGLLETCITFPYYGDIGLFDYHQNAFDYFISNFNGIYELINRDNSSNIIFERYQSMHPSCVNNNYPDFLGRGESVGMSFVSIEMILAQYSVLSRFESYQLKVLAKEALSKHDQKMSNESTNTIFNLKFTLVICGRILEVENYQPFITELNNNIELEQFINQVFVGDVESLEIIKINTMNYIETQ